MKKMKCREYAPLRVIKVMEKLYSIEARKNFRVIFVFVIILTGWALMRVSYEGTPRALNVGLGSKSGHGSGVKVTTLVMWQK
jgi:hypothetical protein